MKGVRTPPPLQIATGIIACVKKALRRLVYMPVEFLLLHGTECGDMPAG